MAAWVSDGAKSVHTATTVTLRKFVKHFIIGFGGWFVGFISVRCSDSLTLLDL